MMSSVSSRASLSTISTPSAVPATTRSSWLVAIWSRVGFSTYWPFDEPTRAAATGPKNGMPDRVSAAEQPIRATMSGSFSMSWLSTVATIWTSLRKPSGNSGRIGRSIRRLVRTLVLARTAFALEEAAGDLAGGEGLFLVVDGQREEVLARLAGPTPTAVQSTMVSP